MPRSKKHVKPNKRKPPRPESFDSPRGWCKLCGGEIIENEKQNKRKNWHPRCGEHWFLMNNPTAMKQYIFERDNHTCQNCNFHSNNKRDFHADHSKPLFEAYGDPGYWEPENVVLLCIDCHAKKTKIDMKLYHKTKNIVNSGEER